MATTYTYHVCQLHTKSTPETNTVEYVDAYLYGEDENGKNTTQQFTFQPPIPESYSGDFVTYEDLTEEKICLLYTSPSPRDRTRSRMPSSA